MHTAIVFVTNMKERMFQSPCEEMRLRNLIFGVFSPTVPVFLSPVEIYVYCITNFLLCQ